MRNAPDCCDFMPFCLSTLINPSCCSQRSAATSSVRINRVRLKMDDRGILKQDQRSRRVETSGKGFNSGLGSPAWIRSIRGCEVDSAAWTYVIDPTPLSWRPMVFLKLAAA